MENNTKCTRCNKPNIIVKTWVETIETRSGKSKLTHTQLACSDKDCQKEFERKLAEEIKKREDMKMRNEAYAAKRRDAAEQLEAGKTPTEKKITLR